MSNNFNIPRAGILKNLIKLYDENQKQYIDKCNEIKAQIKNEVGISMSTFIFYRNSQKSKEFKFNDSGMKIL